MIIHIEIAYVVNLDRAGFEIAISDRVVDYLVKAT